MDDHARLRIRARCAPQRASYDHQSVHRVLDRGQVAHIRFVDGEQPYCIPTLYARAGDEVLIHGSSASRMTRLLGPGVPACLTVTILDGLVLARSAFEHSAIHDSVVILGSFRAVTDPAQNSPR